MGGGAVRLLGTWGECEGAERIFHSLTTWLGEMGDERIDVTISDAATGEVVVNETATTYANGSIGYWLPRD